MSHLHDTQFLILMAAILSVLSVASLIGWILNRKISDPKKHEVILNLNARIRAWWIMIGVFILASLIGPLGTVFLFALMSLLALREYLALSHTIRDDHSVLLWLVFVALPVNYFLVAIKWYGLFSIFIPVYAFIWLQARAAIAGATDGFLDRSARIQWGMMVTIYFVSYVPALLMLDIPGYSSRGENFKLLFFLVLVVQASDVLQYVTGKLFGRHQIAPRISPNKTVEGFIGGVILSTLLGGALDFLTPFTLLQSMGLALTISLMGFIGGLVMSATKRDRGVKDFGALLPGHGGMLDRIDSLCFSAPVFFHLTRYFFS